MAPKAAVLGLHASALPPPSSPQEAQVMRDFKGFVQQHSLYVPSVNFLQAIPHPPRVASSALPPGVTPELRYTSSLREQVRGLHPMMFLRMNQAADLLRVSFYGREAARLLGRGREHFGWTHFAGMSDFAIDNPNYTHHNTVEDFLEALRTGKQVTKLFVPNTSEFGAIYACLQLRPGDNDFMIGGLQALMLFPGVFGGSTSYVSNEVDFYLHFSPVFTAPNFIDRMPELSVRLWYCATLHILLTWLSKGGTPLRLQSAMQPFAGDHLNFCMCPRAAIWLASFGLQLMLEENPTSANVHLRSPIGLLSVRLTSQQITNFIDGNHFRVWNRRYIDYFINVTSGDIEITSAMANTMSILKLPGTWQDFFTLAWNQTSHGRNRYMHMPLRPSDFSRFDEASEGDFWISRALAVQSLRARYRGALLKCTSDLRRFHSRLGTSLSFLTSGLECCGLNPLRCLLGGLPTSPNLTCF